MDDDMYNNIVISPEFQHSQSDFQRIIQTAMEAALRHVPTINVNVTESMDEATTVSVCTSVFLHNVR